MNKIIVGTYTTDTPSQGIYEITIDLVTGELSDLKLIASVPDPSYLAISENGKNLYATNESADFLASGQGSVAGFTLIDNVWQKNFESLSGGKLPCHAAVDRTGRMLAISNYLDGMVRLFFLDENGAMQNDFIDLPGSGRGPNPDRQECSHAHQCIFVQNELWCCDLGTDRIRRYLLPEINNEKISADDFTGSQEIKELEPIVFPAGCGPRHLVMHPGGERAYLVTELTNEIFVIRNKNDGWNIESRFNCLPEKLDQTESYAAAIRLVDSGRKLFVSNRGNDSLSIFELAGDGAVIKREAVTGCGGKWPRDILPVSDYVLCACQNSDEITCLRADENGIYYVCSRISVPSPACLINEYSRTVPE
ncbi:MAG: lactonase family protein [Saccharofermentanales bacterium]